MKYVKLLIALCIAMALIGCSTNIIQDQQNNEPEIVPKSAEEKLKEEQLLRLESMTLDEKIGQLLIVGFGENTADEQLQSYMQSSKVGGFILFKRNYKDFDELYDLTNKLKKMNEGNKLPLFIAVDEEGGTVTRLPKGGTIFPDARLIGKLGNESITNKVGKTIGEELYACGINMNFAPVLDILTDEKSTLLSKRAFGTDGQTVFKQGYHFIEGLKSENIIAVPKHFPGHGGTSEDSHGTLPIISIDENTLKTRELVPFRESINKGIDAIMVGHLAFPNIEKSGIPATMSKKLIDEILRKDLGFKGIAITDEIEMLGFTGNGMTFEESIITSFNAGMDIFVVGHTKKVQDDVLLALKNGVKNGNISKERLNQSVLRIIQVKDKYGLSNVNHLEKEQAKALFGSQSNKEFLQEVKKMIKSSNK